MLITTGAQRVKTELSVTTHRFVLYAQRKRKVEFKNF